jgi:hypothetical protein
MQKTITKIRLVARPVACLIFAYFLVYVLLSLFGQYRPMTEAGLSHWEVYPMWAPYGSFNSHPPAGSQDAKRGGVWRHWLFQAYSRLWGMDNRYIHARHDVYMTGHIDETGRWIYTTNSLSPLVAPNESASNH